MLPCRDSVNAVHEIYCPDLANLLQKCFAACANHTWISRRFQTNCHLEVPPWCAVVPLSWPWQSSCLQRKPISNLCGGTKHGQSLLTGVQIVQEGSLALVTHVTRIVHGMKGSMEMTQTHQIEHGTNMIMERSMSIDLDGIDPHILLKAVIFLKQTIA